MKELRLVPRALCLVPRQLNCWAVGDSFFKTEAFCAVDHRAGPGHLVELALEALVLEMKVFVEGTRLVQLRQRGLGGVDMADVSCCS